MLISAGASHVARVVVESDATNRPRIELAEGDEIDSATMLRRWIEQREMPARLSKRMVEAGDVLIERQRQ